MNEILADNVVALANDAYAKNTVQCSLEAMRIAARRHRVDAIKARAKMEAMTEKFTERFGVERFEQERPKYLGLRRSI